MNEKIGAQEFCSWAEFMQEPFLAQRARPCVSGCALPGDSDPLAALPGGNTQDEPTRSTLTPRPLNSGKFTSCSKTESGRHRDAVVMP
jgi:hypothetical protein